MWLKRFLFTSLKIAVLFAFLVVVAILSMMASIHFLIHSEEVEVPDLIGMDVTEALSVLSRLNLRLHMEEGKGQYSTTIPVNRVLWQNPSPHTTLKVGRKVRVALSLGIYLVRIPNLVGEMSSQAQVQIHESGLRVGDIVYVHSQEVPESAVVAQSPMPSIEKVAADDISLVVSRGPLEVRYVMPDFIYKNIDAAARFLERRGMKYRIETEVYEGLEEGLIIRQKPLSGFPVRQNDLVTFWVSRSSARESTY